MKKGKWKTEEGCRLYSGYGPVATWGRNYFATFARGKLPSNFQKNESKGATNESKFVKDKKQFQFNKQNKTINANENKFNPRVKNTFNNYSNSNSNCKFQPKNNFAEKWNENNTNYNQQRPQTINKFSPNNFTNERTNQNYPPQQQQTPNNKPTQTKETTETPEKKVEQKIKPITLELVIKKLSFPLLWELFRFMEPHGEIPKEIFQNKIILEELSKATKVSDIYQVLQLITSKPEISSKISPSQLQSIHGVTEKLNTYFRPLPVVCQNETLDYNYKILIVNNENNQSQPKIILNEIETKISCRFWRKYSSDRFITVQFDKNMDSKSIEKFCKKGFRLTPTSRMYKFLYCRTLDKEVVFFCVNLNPKLSSIQIRQWHCNTESNSINQKMNICKYNARIALGFSDSVPAIVIPYSSSKIVSDAINWKTKNILTDGCSLISLSFLTKIKENLNLPYVPSVVQGRYGSSKGVWVVGDRFMNEMDMIYLRKSQLKYVLEPQDDFQQTFELLQYSKDRGPASLNRQYIQVLEFLGIKSEVFLALLEESIKYTIYSLIASPEVALTTLNYGKNFGIERELSNLLLAGFDFSEPYVRFKTINLIKSRIAKLKEKANITVKKSRYLLMIADPSNTLKPNEVFVQISDKSIGVIIGDLIATRTPCHYPSDIRIFKSVNNELLHNIFDCIVFSTQGIVSPASLLSGGDYDGDLAWVCWDDRLTSIRQYPPPSSVKDDSSVKKDPSVDITVGSLTPQLLESQMISHFVTQITKNKLAELTITHNKWAESRGINHPITLRLAGLCSLAVDAPKSGLIIDVPSDIGSPPTPHYLNPKGKKSIRALGKLFDFASTDNLVESYLESWFYDFSRSSPHSLISLDEDLVMDNIPEAIYSIAESLRAEFNSKISQVLKKNFDNEHRLPHFSKINLEIKEKFLNSVHDDKSILQLASCIYQITRENDVSLSQNARNFPWIVCYEQLIRLKASAIHSKQNGKTKRKNSINNNHNNNNNNHCEFNEL